MGINVDETYLHDGLYDIKLTYKIFEKIIKSNSLIKEFDPTEASLMFENDMNEKSKEKIPEQKFTEENAWIQI